MTKRGDLSQFVEFLKTIELKNIMATPVISVFEDDELSRVEEKFVSHKIFYLPVVSHDGKLVGVISRKYLYKTQSPRKIMNSDVQYDKSVIVDGHSYYEKETLDSFILRNMMLKDPLTLSPKDHLADAIRQMAAHKLSCIPIVEKDKQVVGIVTHQEIVDYVASILP